MNMSHARKASMHGNLKVGGMSRCMYVYVSLYIYIYMGRCLKERLQKEDKGGHIILESIIFSLRYKAGPQGALLNPKGGARFAIDAR